MKSVLGDRPKISADQHSDAVRGFVAASTDILKPKDAEETSLAEDAKSCGLVEQEIAGFYIVAENGTLAYVKSPLRENVWP